MGDLELRLAPGAVGDLLVEQGTRALPHVGVMCLCHMARDRRRHRLQQVGDPRVGAVARQLEGALRVAEELDEALEPLMQDQFGLTEVQGGLISSHP